MKALNRIVSILMMVILLSSCGAKSNTANEITTETTEAFEQEKNLGEGKWAKAYLDCVEEYFSNYTAADNRKGAYLIYVNNDDVPELYLNGDGIADGDIIYTYDFKTEQLSSQHLYNYGFSYIPKENLFADCGGRMDSYYDYIYSIEDGEFVKKYSGEYGLGAENYEYSWDGVEVSEEAYKNALNSIYDFNGAVKPYDSKSEYPEIFFTLSESIDRCLESEFELTEENLEFLTDCALRLSNCEGVIGSEEFANSFIYNYYIGREKEEMVYDEYGNVCWKAREIEDDYKLIFGEDVPPFDVGENGEVWIWSEDIGELEYSAFYYKGVTKKSNNQFCVSFGEVSADFGYLGGVDLVLERVDNSNGFVIKSIEIIGQNYENILKGDFSAVAGVYEYPSGNSFKLLADGLSEEEAERNKRNDEEKFVVEDITKEKDGSYSWYVSCYWNGECMDGVACILYPVGVEVVAYNGEILETDTSKIRCWTGNAEVSDTQYIAYKID